MLVIQKLWDAKENKDLNKFGTEKIAVEIAKIINNST